MHDQPFEMEPEEYRENADPTPNPTLDIQEQGGGWPDPFNILRQSVGRSIICPSGFTDPIGILDLRGQDDSIVPVTFAIGMIGQPPGPLGIDLPSTRLPGILVSFGSGSAAGADFIIDCWPGQKFTLIGSFFRFRAIPPNLIPPFPNVFTNKDLTVNIFAGILPGSEGNHPVGTYQPVSVNPAASTGNYGIQFYARFLRILRSLDQQYTVDLMDAGGSIIERVVVPAGGPPPVIPLFEPCAQFLVTNNGAAAMLVTPQFEYAL